MMWGYHSDMGWGWAMVGGLMMVAFWATIIWAVVALVRRPQQREGRGEDARAVADRRLASGEISLDEHQRIVARLGR